MNAHFHSQAAWLAAFISLAAMAVSAQRAPTTWDVREVDHPIMGAITVAVPASGLTTAAGPLRIVSAAFVSCEKATRTIAIELANSIESDTRGGLAPLEMPRLVCNGRANGTAVRTEVTARWATNELGDTLARGLSATELRRCGPLEVQQHVKLPAGGAIPSQRIAMSLSPADEGLAKVFAACSDSASAAASTAPTPPAIAKLPAATSPDAAPWRSARTVSSGKTNVRGAPRIDGALVTQLFPGMPLLVQKDEGDWWRVKPQRGNAFKGYVRVDRLAFD